MARYDKLSAQLLARVVRWEHASFALNQLEPFHCERHGWKPGRRLKKAPKDDRGCSYGYAVDGHLLIAREGQFEYLHVYEGDTITRFQFDGPAIAWAKKQGWEEKDQDKAKAQTGITRLFLKAGRMERVEASWPGRRKIVDEYEYDAQGRVSKVRVSDPEHTDELSYDATGALVRVMWRHPSGQASEHFRRPAKEDALPSLLPLIRDKLRVQILRVLKRAKLGGKAYAVVISTCLEEAPHLLPPHVTVGLVDYRDERIAHGGAFRRDEIWNPQAMPLFDDARLRLGDRSLVALCNRANVAREDDRPIVVMLRALAAELQPFVAEALPSVPELLVYAMDVGGEDAEKAARAAAGKPLAQTLKKLKLL